MIRESQPKVRTAAMIAIGNELLSGKVRDTNVALVIDCLHAWGTPLREVRVIGDEVDAIARAVAELSACCDHVITSGGVGPTHDDVTLEGIARAFDQPLVRNERLAGMIRAFYGAKTNEHLLRMADLPSDARLLEREGLPIPVVCVRNVFVLPGEPTIFERKFRALEDVFRQRPFVLKRLYTLAEEGELAGLLAEVQQNEPDVAIGSYPRYDNAAYKVLVTFESRNAEALERAFEAVRSKIDPNRIVQVE